ncbi:hypothetical protein RB653_007521 [Dictyostelium firmibasis]|uniref:Uncharacterized protein n=1 Tax=Dictyostelium firmibasis TaxID=79012 RepID=A0AAN7YXQ0_9MYCE
MNKLFKYFILFIVLLNLTSIAISEGVKEVDDALGDVNMCAGLNQVNCLFNFFILHKCMWSGGKCKKM